MQPWKIETKSLSDLEPLNGNPRTIGDAELAALMMSISQFGFVEPIVWNERTGHIVGGHQRRQALLKLGVSEATVVVVDMTEEDEIDANVTLNNPGIEGEWDDPIDELLDREEVDDPELFEALRMDELRASLEGRTPPQDFDTECPCCGHKWEVRAEDVTVE
jgi:ParB-like chromosome segregation protein Spo0J